MSDTDWVMLRFDLLMRSKGRCEFCRDPFVGGSAVAHHRRLRSQGGKHTMENLVFIHDACHRWAHAHPAMSYDLGWLVHSWDDPADVAVQIAKPWLTKEKPGL